MTSSLCKVWPCMYGIPNGTLEADQAANVPALGRNKSCVCHVCAGLAHACYTHTHIWSHRYWAQRFLHAVHIRNMGVYVMYGYHIRAAHNSDSKSTETPPVILSLCQQICLFFHSLPAFPSDCLSNCPCPYLPDINQNRLYCRLNVLETT